MSNPVADFWRAAEALAPAYATVRREPDGYTELFIPTSSGTLEISGHGEFVSVACGTLFIEDRAVRRSEDADFLLAVCDAVLANRASFGSQSVRIELSTRGHSQVWTA